MSKAFPSPTQLPQIQIIPSPKGATLLVNPLPAPHRPVSLVFLNALRAENLDGYLDAIAQHRFGEAAFLEGGLKGIDTVIHHRAPYDNQLTQGETQLQRAIAHQDWTLANWWKGFVCGLELAIKVQRLEWYKPSRWGDRLLDWFDRPRGAYL